MSNCKHVLLVLKLFAERLLLSNHCLIQVQALGLLAKMMDSKSHKNFLIVVDSLADVRHWAGQIAHFVPDLCVIEYHSSKDKRTEASVGMPTTVQSDTTACSTAVA